MKILFIATSYIYPPVKGYQVMLCRHIEQLARRHSIDLLAFGDASKRSSDIDPIIDSCNSVELISLPKWRMVLNLLFGIFSSDPLQVCLYSSSCMLGMVAMKLQSRHYDVVICQLSRVVQFVPECYSGHKLLNMVDPLVLNYSRSFLGQPWYLRVALKYEVARLRRYE
jgi:hypothetical protein